MRYSADLGTWQEGLVREFTAQDLQKAIEKAHKILKKLYSNDDTKYVVQISEINYAGTKTLIWDYMNGNLS